ncbi:MAG: bifunctional adenosylcobinamide kinase/adenosylcobinamide-phosphate guanylyltransferase [Arcobacteraceae bacterium]
MKILYFGGQKCGKTNAGTKKTLELAKEDKPYYIATYDNTFNDTSMGERVKKHISQRKDDFFTIEEPRGLSKIIKPNKTYLVDCVSMWIFNNLEKSEEELKEQIRAICAIKANVVFILNDVSCGVIPCDSQSRKFVDLSGIIGQELVKLCNEVYEVKYGLEKKLK